MPRELMSLRRTIRVSMRDYVGDQPGSQTVERLGGLLTLALYTLRCAVENRALRRNLRPRRNAIVANAEARAKRAQDADTSDRRTRKGSKADALRATREFVEWIIESRKRNARAAGIAEPQPVGPGDARQRQREAIKAGADPRIIEAIDLTEPDSLIELDAERRLMEQVLGRAVR